MIKLGVSITYLETVEISDKDIEEYREEYPDATIDEIKEAFVQAMLEDNHYWDYNDLDYEEVK
jgi:hypothetical protein